jgi:hypothetical protein
LRECVIIASSNPQYNSFVRLRKDTATIISAT